MYFCSICVSCILGYKLSMICIADRNKDLFVFFVCSSISKKKSVEKFHEHLFRQFNTQ